MLALPRSKWKGIHDHVKLLVFTGSILVYKRYCSSSSDLETEGYIIQSFTPTTQKTKET